MPFADLPAKGTDVGLTFLDCRAKGRPTCVEPFRRLLSLLAENPEKTLGKEEYRKPPGRKEILLGIVRPTLTFRVADVASSVT